MEYPRAFLQYQEAPSQRSYYVIQEAFVECRGTIMEHQKDFLEYQESIQGRNTKNVYEIQVRYSGIPSRF